MPNHVVLVDDDPFNLKIAKNILTKNDINVTTFRSGFELLDFLREDIPDLILLDIMMPKLNGFETLNKVREFEKEKDIEEIPVIFLTSDDDNKSETLGFEMGVADYIRKPFEPAVLIKRISNVLNRQEMLHRFHEEATIDNLTGLLNKAATNEKLEMLCKRKHGILMMIDLDSFKLVNDIYGHDAGDKILTSFSDLIKGLLGPDDIIGRIGGDEFTAFSVTLKNEEDIKEFTLKLNSALLKEARIILGEDMDIPLGASVGAIFLNGNGTVYSDALKKADKALYNVKHNVKHGYSIYEEESDLEDTYEINLNTISMILSERNISSSALKLDMSSFVGVYRFVMRYAMRYHRNACKILVTLTPREDLGNEETTHYFEEFGEHIGQILRKSDLLMQVRKNMYFIILTDIKAEAVDQVAGNIIRKWRSKFGDVLDISYETEFLESEPLYTGSGDAYNGDFYATVDMQRLPGTTIERSANRAADPYFNWYLPEARNTYAFAGGATLGKAGIAGMQYRGQGNGKERTLEVKKSWFMFDKEVVCLGSGISTTTDNQVETIVLNDRLLSKDLRFRVLSVNAEAGFIG